MEIDHIGYVVKNLDKAKEAMETLGYLFGEIIKDAERNIYIIFGEMNGYRIELVAPMSQGSPVDTYLSKIGATPYNICYKSKNIEEDIENLRKSQFKVSIPLTPAIAFGGKRVVFLYSLSLGLIEIVEQ